MGTSNFGRGNFGRILILPTGENSIILSLFYVFLGNFGRLFK